MGVVVGVGENEGNSIFALVTRCRWDLQQPHRMMRHQARARVPTQLSCPITTGSSEMSQKGANHIQSI